MSQFISQLGQVKSAEQKTVNDCGDGSDQEIDVAVSSRGDLIIILGKN